MNSSSIIPQEAIINKIFFIRSKKVMLDKDLAELYGVTTGNLNKVVGRNLSRFPEDFMFLLSKAEARLIFQFGISKKGRGGRRNLPYVFTEQGVAMLSSILKSERAVQMNIQIIRTFTKLREILSENKSLAEKIEKMESKYDKDIAHIFDIIRHLVAEEIEPKEKLGFDLEK